MDRNLQNRQYCLTQNANNIFLHTKSQFVARTSACDSGDISRDATEEKTWQIKEEEVPEKEEEAGKLITQRKGGRRNGGRKKDDRSRRGMFATSIVSHVGMGSWFCFAAGQTAC